MPAAARRCARRCRCSAGTPSPLLACALWLRQGGVRQLRQGGFRVALHLAGACFVTGTLCFTVGVVVPALGGPHLGILAPTGGSLLMLGWTSLAVSALL